MSAILFENARIVDPSRGLDETGSLLIENGKIVAAGSRPVIRARRKVLKLSIWMARL